MQYEWYSPLSPEECARRIKARLSNGSLFLHSDHPFWGHVWERGFSVRLAQGWRNPMAPFFKAHLEPRGSGTVVRGECRILKAAKIGATIWALLWILLPCTLTVSVDVVWITFLLVLGDSLRALDEETYRTLLTLPIAMWWMPVMGVVFALGFPALFIAVRQGDCEKICTLLEDILEIKAPPRRADGADVDRRNGMEAP